MRLLLPLLIASTASAAPCPVIENIPKPLTKSGAAIADGGGIVVALVPQQGSADTAPKLATWKLDGKPVVIDHLAPGLDVVKITKAATLTDGAKLKLAVTKGAAAPVLDAPKVDGIRRDAPANSRHPYVITHATFTSDAPATAVAVIVFDDKGAARSWGAQVGKDAAVYARGGCNQLVEGTTDSNVGDAVTLAYVDASGRIGKKSAPITIK